MAIAQSSSNAAIKSPPPPPVKAPDGALPPATTTPLTPRAIEIWSRMRVGVYDCLYVALAERERCELVTADDKLLKTLKPQFPFILDLKTFP